tara:strand:+ start:151 stop:288 length:138 start_codon:yes stop_codon:yes gene_type:complete
MLGLEEVLPILILAVPLALPLLVEPAGVVVTIIPRVVFLLIILFV